jgi:ABC-2 type transport system ATP-binding protein
VTGFLGPNGAGKSTTMRVMVGLTPATSGSATVLGRKYSDLPNPGREVGVLLDASAQHAGRTGTETLKVAARTMGLPMSRVDDMLDLVSLTGTEAERRVKNYSLGMRQRLGIAQALLGEPSVLILDEPANGLDPNGVVDIRHLISQLARDGITIFLSSHVLPEVEQLCKRVAILQAGRIVAEGETQAMLQQGERLFVRFDDAADAGRARSILDQVGPTTPAEAEAAFLVQAGANRGSDVIRALAAADLFPTEVGVRRQTLEAVFIELTGEPDAAPAVATPAGTAMPG